MTRIQYSMMLWLLCIISPFALIPFENAVASFVGFEPLAVTMNGMILAALEAAIIYGMMIYYGMRWATNIGARFLLLENNYDLWKDLLKPGLITGIACTTAILSVDALLPASPLNLHALALSIPPKIGFFCLIFCIVNQQVFLSLFCVSGIATLLKKEWEDLSASARMVLSIFATSILFGLAHIPVFVRPEMADIPLVITRIMVLTLFSGVAFGYLFWKKSFETAIFGHMVVDAILYVLVPWFGLWMQ